MPYLKANTSYCLPQNTTLYHPFLLHSLKYNTLIFGIVLVNFIFLKKSLILSLEIG